MDTVGGTSIGGVVSGLTSMYFNMKLLAAVKGESTFAFLAPAAGKAKSTALAVKSAAVATGGFVAAQAGAAAASARTAACVGGR